jgi:hypothetical protein
MAFAAPFSLRQSLLDTAIRADYRQSRRIFGDVCERFGHTGAGVRSQDWNVFSGDGDRALRKKETLA